MAKNGSFRIFNLAVSNAERYLPGTLPSNVEVEAPVLPATWSRLYAPCLKSNGSESVQLKVLLSNLTGRIARAHAVERALAECDGVESPQCFLPTGQRVHSNSATGLPATLSGLVYDAFCGMAVQLPVGSTRCGLDEVDANIVDCMSWYWLVKENDRPLARGSIASRL